MNRICVFAHLRFLMNIASEVQYTGLENVICTICSIFCVFAHLRFRSMLKADEIMIGVSA